LLLNNPVDGGSPGGVKVSVLEYLAELALSRAFLAGRGFESVDEVRDRDKGLRKYLNIESVQWEFDLFPKFESVLLDVKGLLALFKEGGGFFGVEIEAIGVEARQSFAAVRNDGGGRGDLLDVNLNLKAVRVHEREREGHAATGGASLDLLIPETVHGVQAPFRGEPVG
jgi:hypothetical protein